MKYTNKDCKRFVRDMEAAGLEVEHYHGRYCYQGPAVRADSVHDVIICTKVTVQHDQMGHGVIVYPVASDDGTGAGETRSHYA